MDENMHFITEESEFLDWISKHEESKVINEAEARMLLDYLEGHDYRLSTDKEDKLVRVDINSDDYETIEYTIDDLIDCVCEWNYELIRCTMDEMGDSNISLEQFMKLDEKITYLRIQEVALDKLFEQTRYSVEIEKLAEQLVNSLVENLQKDGIDKAVKKLCQKVKEEFVKEGDRGGR